MVFCNGVSETKSPFPEQASPWKLHGSLVICRRDHHEYLIDLHVIQAEPVADFVNRGQSFVVVCRLATGHGASEDQAAVKDTVLCGWPSDYSTKVSKLLIPRESV